jgi:hypothetical protein
VIFSTTSTTLPLLIEPCLYLRLILAQFSVIEIDSTVGQRTDI